MTVGFPKLISLYLLENNLYISVFNDKVAS